MKRLFFYLLIISIALTVTSCNKMGRYYKALYRFEVADEVSSKVQHYHDEKSDRCVLKWEEGDEIKFSVTVYNIGIVV